MKMNRRWFAVRCDYLPILHPDSATEVLRC